MAKTAEKQPRPDKVEEVEILRDLIEKNSTAIFTDYRGLSVKDMSAVRKKLRDSNTQFRVVKNTLFRRAAAGSSIEEFAASLEGPTAVVLNGGDPVVAAKALLDYIRESRSPMVVKGAVVDGQALPAEGVTALSKIPGKQQLVAMVVGGLQSPITGLVGTLNMLIVQAVMTLQAVADQKSEAA